jgi:RND superfamily putative drug exporter
VLISRGNGYTILNVGLPVDPLDDRVFELLESIRGTIKPLDGESMVTGFTALRVDAVNSIMSSYFKTTLPLALALIIAYLIAGMGSVLVPLRLAVTVAFSTVLSLAITTIAFHYLVETPAYGSQIRSPIYWVTPIVVLGLMITLGMDYDIFLTSRIREEHERGGDQDRAILEAVEKTGVAITVCGLILAGAFSSLLLTEITLLRQVGLTVATSILIDTFIVRPVIVPAVMSLLGRYNWWPGRGLIRRWD